MTPLPPGEVTAAALGFSDLLRKEPRRVTAKDLDEMRALPRKVRKACRDFMAKPDFAARAPGLARIDYHQALEQLHTPDDVHHVEAVHEAFHDRHDVADAYLAVADRAVAHLLPMLPVRSVQTMTELRQIEPSRQEFSRFLRAWTVANSPLLLLEQLAAGTVSSHAVEAVVVIFPALYEFMKAELFRSLAREKAKRSSYVIPGGKDRELCRLLQVPIVPGALAREMQKAFGQEAEKVPEPSAGPNPSKSAESYQTPIGRAEAR